ncbi:Rv1355c family protein [Mycobacterium sp.]|uniref:Rv1355c family protein n=1 Tax=Mycobacterium sp. TaxID=1785 RepID=UPI0025CC730A|nr:Rv1355c family protein [Mycobacterium sp.]MBW0013419.1 Rv1355c family protein [Mycobacterium sp.]
MDHNHGRDDTCRAVVLADDAADRDVLDRLRATPGIEFVDRLDREPADSDHKHRWVYYPWRNAVVKVPGPRAFAVARLDRNRHLITASEQQRLQRQRIGVVGLSSGHAVAYCLAVQGLCGALRLADGDVLELPNLNRVPASVLELGLNKATVAARRIAELDPYLDVEVFTSGVTTELVDRFLDGLDVLVDQADSLDIKVLIRQAARNRGIPVLMATSDRGQLDVERFDLQPRPPILHGLLGDIDATALAGLSTRDKLPYLLRLLDPARLSARGAASLVEVGQTLTGWPQLASDIWLGAAAVAEAVRRIGMGEPLRSGRIQINLADILDRIDQPVTRGEDVAAASGAAPLAGAGAGEARIADVVADAAIRAPSGGNSQPWRIVVGDNSIQMLLAAEDSSTMDVEFRASAVALGAAMFNARIAAAACAALGPVSFDDNHPDTALQGEMVWGNGDDPRLAELYAPMLARQTNRHAGTPVAVQPAIAARLEAVTADEGARLRLITDRQEIEAVADILSQADRIRYLTPRLHADMVSELRWPTDPSPETGIDVRGLELDSGELAALDLIRRPDVMAELARWDAGAALGDIIRQRVTASAALAVVAIEGSALTDYARGGAALEALWIAAQQSGFGVHPVSPVFLYAHNDQDLQTLSARYAERLRTLRQGFRALVGLAAGEHEILLLRLVAGPAPSVPARRRPLSASMCAPR